MIYGFRTLPYCILTEGCFAGNSKSTGEKLSGTNDTPSVQRRPSNCYLSCKLSRYCLPILIKIVSINNYVQQWEHESPTVLHNETSQSEETNNVEWIL